MTTFDDLWALVANYRDAYHEDVRVRSSAFATHGESKDSAELVRATHKALQDALKTLLHAATTGSERPND